MKFFVLAMIVLLLQGNIIFAADNKTSFENELTILQKQLLEMKEQIKILESQLEVSLQGATSARVQAEQASQAVEREMTSFSSKFKSIDDLSGKFKHLKLNGLLRLRWWEGDHQQNSFDIFEIQFHVRYDLSENISGEFHLMWHPSGNMSGRAEYANYSNAGGDTTYIESAFAEFRNLNIGPVEGKLLVGKLRNQAFGIVPGLSAQGRVTADYGLFFESNNAARITGLHYLTTWKDFQWNFAIFNGYSLQGDSARYGARSAGIRYLRTGQMDLDDNDHKAFSTKLWYKPSADQLKDLQFGYSYLHQKLSDNDLANFNLIMGRNAGMQDNFWGNPTNSRSDIRIGPSLTYDKGHFSLRSEYFWGTIADVDMNWWYVTLGYKLKQYRVEFWLRYAQANYDQKTIADIKASGAWDKAQWTPCIIYHLHPMTDLYFEYYFNDVNEPRGAHKLNNNYGFIELVIKY